MQSFIHDLRRNSCENEPLVHQANSLKGFNLRDDDLDSGMNCFSLAETRLAGNGSAAIVLAAAFTGMWSSLTGSGRDSIN